MNYSIKLIALDYKVKHFREVLHVPLLKMLSKILEKIDTKVGIFYSIKHILLNSAYLTEVSIFTQLLG